MYDVQVRQVSAVTRYAWEKGTVDKHNPETDIFNPLFRAALIDQGRCPSVALGYPHNPILRFHLASASLTIWEKDKLSWRSSRNLQPDRLVRTAKKQFADWVAALRETRSRVSFTFVAADFTVFCHTLQHSLATGKSSAYMQRRQLDPRPFVLDEHWSGPVDPTMPTPRHFDVIDATHLPGSYGVEILHLARPLLKDRPSSSLYSVTLAQLGADGVDFNSLYDNCATTISILLGLAPIEYWTNAAPRSNYDDCYFRKVADQPVRHRLLWKLNKHLRGALAGAPCILSLSPEALAACLVKLLTCLWSLPGKEVGYDFAGFAQFVHAVCRTVQTDVRRLGLQLTRLLPLHPGNLTKLHRNRLIFELGLIGGFSVPKLVRATAVSSYGSNNDGQTLCVTLMLAYHDWYSFAKRYESRKRRDGEYDICLPSAELRFYHQQDNDKPLLLLHSAVHITICKVGKGSAYSETGVLDFNEDPRGFASHSHLVISFLTVTIPELLQLSGAIWMRIAGDDSILKFSLEDPFRIKHSSVIIRNCYVGLEHLPIYGGGPTAISTTDHSPSDSLLSPLVKGVHTRTVEATDSALGQIVGFRHRVHLKKQEREIFDKGPQLRWERVSPFTHHLVVGKSAIYPLHFPLPVSQQMQCWWPSPEHPFFQVESRLAEPGDLDVLEDYIYPTVLDRASNLGALPVTLSMAHVSLPNLPHVNLEAYEDEDGETENMLIGHTQDTISPRDRELEGELGRLSPGKPQRRSARLDFKLRMKDLFRMGTVNTRSARCLSLDALEGLHGPQILIATLGLFVDGGNGSVMLAAAVIPWTATMMRDSAVQEFRRANETKYALRMLLDEKQLKVWKKVLPAMAERCREWSHSPRCEYTDPGATVPLSLNPLTPCLCSCGQGKLGSHTDGLSMPEK
jgi:hypothetical protein